MSPAEKPERCPNREWGERAFDAFDPRGRRSAPGAMPRWNQYRVAWEVAGGVQERFFDDMDEAFDWCRKQRAAGASVAVFRQHVKESQCGRYPVEKRPFALPRDAEPGGVARGEL